MQCSEASSSSSTASESEGDNLQLQNVCILRKALEHDSEPFNSINELNQMENGKIVLDLATEDKLGDFSSHGKVFKATIEVRSLLNLESNAPHDKAFIANLERNGEFKEVVLKEFKDSQVMKKESIIYDKLKSDNPCNNINLPQKLFDCLLKPSQKHIIISEFIEGALLKDVKYKLSIKDITNIFWDLLKTIKFMIQRGVVHRDIKDDNIIINKGGAEAFLLDFSGARAFDNRFRDDRKGTTEAQPPEYKYAKGAWRDIDLTKFDLYGLGKVVTDLICCCEESVDPCGKLVALALEILEAEADSDRCTVEKTGQELMKITNASTMQPASAFECDAPDL